MTDAATLPNLKRPSALSHDRVLTGGLARETTIRLLHARAGTARPGPCATTSRTPATQTLTHLALFRSDHHADISLSQWMGALPPELVKAHLNPTR